MASIRCTVTLVSDTSRKVDIEIIKEKNSRLLWKEIKSSGGNLHLATPKGTWETNYGDVLTLWYETGGTERKRYPNFKALVTLVLFDVKKDFFDDVINNGKTIETENAGLYNDNPSETEVTCKLARMH
jgi:hypothetical protein